MDLFLPPRYGRGDFARRAAGCVCRFPAKLAGVAPGHDHINGASDADEKDT